jgi:3-oxoacyl-[acyl-carrier protein] reductase
MSLHEHRRYLVTGASDGLGYACAEALMSEGGAVVVSSRDATRISKAAAALGPSAVAFPGDLGDPAFAAAVAAQGPFDGAVISVGGPAAGRALSVSDEAWVKAYDTVFLGTLRLIRELCKEGHLTQGSAIAVVLSTSAKAHITGLSISNGLRPGLAMLISDIAEEIGPLGLRVIGLLPGRFDTSRVQSLDDASGDAATARSTFELDIPLGRYGDPAEFGAVASFMLSRQASYVTGTCITIDGGFSRMP